MKKLYILLLLATTTGTAQLPVSRYLFQKDPGAIANQEKLVYEQQQLRQSNTADFTVASHNYDVSYYHCEWIVDPSKRYINGCITTHFTATESSGSITLDLDSLFTVDSVLYHGNKIIFQKSPQNGLTLQWPSTITSGQKDSVTIFYQGVPDSLKTKVVYQGFYRGSYAMWTLSEPYGAGKWWPCKNNLADKADSLDIVITIPETYTASSNGLLTGESITAGQKTSYFKHRYPIAAYLVAFAVTKYTITKDSVFIGNRQMPVLMYSFPFDVNYYKPATIIVKQCLEKFSELFGLYPFYKEQYCQTQWGALSGGMEHQTNSFIIDRWADLVAHELGHQWFGDKVTCGSWQDIWLNEGFATYSSVIYFELFDTAFYKPFLNNTRNSAMSQPDGSVWVPDTTSVSRIFSSRLTYNKGACVVHMLRWVLGDAVFFKGIRDYLNDPAVQYGYARTADLKRVLESVSGKNLDNFFTKWIYGEGYPSYQLNWRQNLNNWAHITLKQTTSHYSVSFYDMPVPVQFKSAGRDTIIVLDHQYNGQQFWVNVGFEADTVIIDPQLQLLSKNNITAMDFVNSGMNSLTVYPNPAPGQLFISLKNPSDKKLFLQMFNAAGQLVYRKELDTPGQDELITIPTVSLAHGVYWLKIKSDKRINTTRKIVR